MMCLVEFDNPGLLLLPYHKVVGGLAPEQLAQLQERLLNLFDAEPVNPAGGGRDWQGWCWSGAGPDILSGWLAPAPGRAGC